MTERNIRFMDNRKYAFIFSGLLTLISIVSLAVQGLHLGLDFTGGVLVEASYQQEANLNLLRESLGKNGFADPTVQYFGSTKEVLIRLKPVENMTNAQINTKVLTAINDEGKQQVDIRRVEFIGPQVGETLAQDGFLALLYSSIGILIYVAWRFEWKFSVGSIIATMHDVIVTLGVFSVFRLEFDLTVLAGILALIGYSLNDTIVVYDRIRESFTTYRDMTTAEIMNHSINDTLSRTIMTSMTVFLVLVCLFLLGGDVIHNFSIAMLFGVAFGTYSSIFIASPAALLLGVSPQDLIVPVKEGADFGGMP